MNEDNYRRLVNKEAAIAAKWIQKHYGCNLGTQYGPWDSYYCMCSGGKHRVPGSKKLYLFTAWPLDLSLGQEAVM